MSAALPLAGDAALRNFLRPLRPFLGDAEVTDIAVNRPGEVWTLSPAGKQQHLVPELSLYHCQQLATVVATHNGKGIHAGKPILSGSLPDGERIEIVVPPRCAPGTVIISIRKPSLTDKTLDDLEQQGSFAAAQWLTISPYDEARLDDAQLSADERLLLQLLRERKFRDFLEQAVRSRRNLIIAGKTGSGKTTVTKALIQCIPPQERLVTIEDVHELFLTQRPDKVHFFYSRGDGGDADASAKSVLASCLRHNPDRILLAELRGDETWEYVQSINSGHPGSISTVHANDALMTFDRLTTLILNTPSGALLGERYISSCLFKTIDVVLFYQQRQLREVYYDPGYKRELIRAVARDVPVR